MMSSFNWKTVFKGWAGVPVLILVVLAVIWLFTNGFPGYKSWQARRAYEKLAEPYYKDTYGGKTPEETYDMFIAALKKGDVELASKYFVIEKQDNWLKTLAEYKKNNLLIGFIKELEDTRKIWEKSDKSTEDIISFVYPNIVKEDKLVDFQGQQIKIPAGNYQNESIFQKYPSKIWKIETL